MESKTSNSNRLGNDTISKLLLKFSIPAIIGMVVNALYNIVDRMFIGKYVGKYAFAGALISYPSMIIIIAFVMLIGTGGSALMSIKMGEKENDEAEKILGNSFSLLLIFSFVLMVITLIFIDPILSMFGASKNTLPYAREYLSIIAYGFPLQMIGFGMNNFIRASGSPLTAMFSMIIGAISNIILDYIFLGILNIGIGGAAYATIISQGIASTWVLLYFLRNKGSVKLKFENLKVSIKKAFHIFQIGFPQFSMQIASIFVIVAFNRSLSKYGGDDAVSVFGIINSGFIMSTMPIFGITQGAQPIIGYNFGAKKYKRVKKTLKLSIIVASIFSTISFFLFQIFPREIASFFTDSKEILEMSIPAIRKGFLLFPIVGFQIVSSSYFQSTGKPRKAFILSMSRQVIVLIPLILILPNFLGLNGIWYAPPSSDLISGILTSYILFKDIQILNKDIDINCLN